MPSHCSIPIDYDDKFCCYTVPASSSSKLQQRLRHKQTVESKGLLFLTIADEQDYVDDYLTNIPDIVWFVLSREPSPIPSSLPGIDASLRDKPSVTLPAPPKQAWELRRFLQNERFERPRDFLYRFWACDGFVLCNPKQIRMFLYAFDYLTICDFVPFLRTCLKASPPTSILQY